MLGDTAVAVHPDDERYRHLVGTRDRAAAHRPARSRSSPTSTSTRSSAPARSRSPRRTTRTTSRSASGTTCRRSTIMDERGVITAHGPFQGLDRFEARPAIVAALRAAGPDRRREAAVRALASGTARAARPTDRAAAVAAVVRQGRAAGQGRRRRGPRRPGRRSTRRSWRKRYFDWVDNMHDWCISRQLWWGHRIPVWYGPNGEVVCVGPDERAADRRGLDAGHGRARHLVLLRRCGRSPRSAGRSRPPSLAKFYPNSRAGHRLRHPVLLGRPDDDVRPVRDGRRAAVPHHRAARHGPRPVRQEDVEVVRQRRRPAGLDGRATAPTPPLHPGPRRQPGRRRADRRGLGRRRPATSATSSGTPPGSR